MSALSGAKHFCEEKMKFKRQPLHSSRSASVRSRVVAAAGLRSLAALLACVALQATASAQNYPDRPIRLIVPFPAGGSIDMVPRALGPAMTELLGQPVVVDNRPGATGKIGVLAAKAAAPDGYSFGIANAVTHGIAPAINSNVGYDPVNDMVPVVWLGEAPNGFFVNSKVPAKSVKELAELIRKNPGKYNYGSGGHGTGQHVNATIFLATTGVPQSASTHVPYKGEGPALSDLVAGHVSYMITSGSKDLVDRGDLRLFATTGKTRWSRYPDVPTTAEVGLPNIYYTGWVGIVAPKGTPQAVIDKINQAANKALQDPKARQVLAANGYEPRGGSPADFAKHLQSEAERWKKQVKETGVDFEAEEKK
jgi:tripartite-type tricarboxylate transporter receptor subunit TctC